PGPDLAAPATPFAAPGGRSAPTEFWRDRRHTDAAGKGRRAPQSRSAAVPPASAGYVARPLAGAHPSKIRRAAAGTPRDAAGFQFAQARFLVAIIERDPADQDQHHRRDQRV